MAVSSQWAGVLFALCTTVLWGFLGIGLKYAMQFVSVPTVVWFRFATAFFLLFIFYLWRRPAALRILKRPPWAIVLAGVGLAINYYGYQKGVQLTTPGITQTLILMSPLLLAVVGVTYFKEKLKPVQRIGFGTAFLGFAVFYRDQLVQLVDQMDAYIAGSAWVFVSALAWVLWAVLNKSFMQKRGASPQVLNMTVYGVAALVFAIPADYASLAQLSALELGVLFFLGVNTLVAYGCINEAIKRIPSNQVAMITSITPVIALGAMKLLESYDLPWLGRERVGWLGYVGAGLVVAGVVLVVGKNRVPHH